MKFKVLLFIIICPFITSSILTISSETRSTQLIDDTYLDSWHFIALGDTRQQLGVWNDTLGRYPHENSSNPIRAALINSIVENNPVAEFILHTGDIVTSGAEQDDWNRYFEDIENATKNNVTFYYATGNHEKYTYALDPGVWGA